MVINRFKALLSVKAAREHRAISIPKASKETGLSTSLLYAWRDGAVSRFDAVVLEKLCGYLGCTIGDLLVYRR